VITAGGPACQVGFQSRHNHFCQALLAFATKHNTQLFIPSVLTFLSCPALSFQAACKAVPVGPAPEAAAARRLAVVLLPAWAVILEALVRRAVL
jgi:hypothetical protein